MRCSLFALAALLLVGVALAVPAPEPFVSGWSKPMDPDGDCQIKRGNGSLTIEMPGGDHDYNPRRRKINAPRLFRESGIEGDFMMQVRVRIDCRPSIQSTAAGQPSFVSASFLVILPDDFCIRMEFGVSRKGNGVDGYTAVIKWDHKNKQGGTLRERGWKGDAYLRLERRRGDLVYSISSDGENWRGLALTVGIREKLKVGLVACSTSTESSKVRFDQLKITRGKKKT